MFATSEKLIQDLSPHSTFEERGAFLKQAFENAEITRIVFFLTTDNLVPKQTIPELLYVANFLLSNKVISSADRGSIALALVAHAHFAKCPELSLALTSLLQDSTKEVSLLSEEDKATVQQKLVNSQTLQDICLSAHPHGTKMQFLRSISGSFDFSTDPTIVDAFRWALHNNKDIAHQFLMEIAHKGGDKDFPDGSFLPLHEIISHASFSDEMSTLGFALDLNAFSINRKDSNGLTPLGLACLLGNMPMMEMLLKGRKANARGNYHVNSPLNVALACKSVPMMTALLNAMYTFEPSELRDAYLKFADEIGDLDLQALIRSRILVAERSEGFTAEEAPDLHVRVFAPALHALRGRTSIQPDPAGVEALRAVVAEEAQKATRQSLRRFSGQQ